MTERKPRRVKVPREPYLYERRSAAGRRVFEVGWRDPDRRQHWRTVEGGLLAARAERDRILGARASGGQPTANPRLRFGEAAEQWLAALEDRDLRSTTKADLERVVRRRLAPRLHTCRLDSISADDLMRILTELRAEGLGERSLALMLAVVGRIYRHASRRLGWAGQDPTRMLERHERPKPSRDRRRAIFEREALEETIREAHEPCRTLFKVLAGTGCRISEALALTWENLYLDDDARIAFRWQVDRQGQRRSLKTDASARVVPIPSRLATALKAHAARRTSPGEYVFATRSGRPLSQRNVARELRRAQKAATRANGTPTFPMLHGDGVVPRAAVPGPHSFRHTAASRFLLAGDTADEVAALLGHKDATVTRAVYLHEIEDAERRALRRERIDSEFGAALDA
jgi:integrase